MTSDQLKWLRLLGAQLRAYLGADPVLPHQIEKPLARLRESEGTEIKFVSDTNREDDPPEDPRQV